ncbi:unnamed protein product [Amoebophrya sp. A25]|nr:unnamed protein product [Amoebophrya sp. A25]|eukprot:GSA25T00020925001.1
MSFFTARLSALGSEMLLKMFSQLSCCGRSCCAGGPLAIRDGVGEDCSTVIVTCGEVFTGSLADAGRTNGSKTSNANQTRAQIREITRTCHRNTSSGATTTGESLPPSKETCRAEQAEVVDPLDLAEDKELTNLIGLLNAAFPRIVESRESSFDAAFEGRGADGACRLVSRSSSSSTSARSTSASNKISRTSTTRRKSKEEEIQLGDEKHLPELLLDCKGRKTSPTGANLPPGSSQPSLSEVDSFTFEEAALLLSRVHKLVDEDDGTVTNAEDDDQLQENSEIQQVIKRFFRFQWFADVGRAMRALRKYREQTDCLRHLIEVEEVDEVGVEEQALDVKDAASASVSPTLPEYPSVESVETTPPSRKPAFSSRQTAASSLALSRGQDLLARSRSSDMQHTDRSSCDGLGTTITSSGSKLEDERQRQQTPRSCSRTTSTGRLKTQQAQQQPTFADDVLLALSNLDTEDFRRAAVLLSQYREQHPDYSNGFVRCRYTASLNAGLSSSRKLLLEMRSQDKLFPDTHMRELRIALDIARVRKGRQVLEDQLISREASRKRVEERVKKQDSLAERAATFLVDGVMKEEVGVDAEKQVGKNDSEHLQEQQQENEKQRREQKQDNLNLEGGFLASCSSSSGSPASPLPTNQEDHYGKEHSQPSKPRRPSSFTAQDFVSITPAAHEKIVSRPPRPGCFLTNDEVGGGAAKGRIFESGGGSSGRQQGCEATTTAGEDAVISISPGSSREDKNTWSSWWFGQPQRQRHAQIIDNISNHHEHQPPRHAATPMTMDDWPEDLMVPYEQLYFYYLPRREAGHFYQSCITSQTAEISKLLAEQCNQRAT